MSISWINLIFSQALVTMVALHLCYLYVASRLDPSNLDTGHNFIPIHITLHFSAVLFFLSVATNLVSPSIPPTFWIIFLVTWMTLITLILFEIIEPSRLRVLAIIFSLSAPIENLISMHTDHSLASFLKGYKLFTSDKATIDALTLFEGLYAYVMIYALLTYYVNRGLKKRVSEQEENPQNEGFDTDSLHKLAWLFPASIALVGALAVASADVPSLTIATGLIAGAIGLATKDVITNLAAGYFLLWSETIQKNDVISFPDGTYGVVTKITARNTIVRTRDRVHLIIPNNILLSDRIENWTHDLKETRLKLDIWVGYGSDLTVVERCLVRAARNAGERVLRDPPPKALVIASDDSGIRMQMRFFIKDPEGGIRNISSVVYKEAFRELETALIEIPYPKLDVQIAPGHEARERTHNSIKLAMRKRLQERRARK